MPSTDPDRRRNRRRTQYQRRAVDQHVNFNEQDLENFLQGSAGAGVGLAGKESKSPRKWTCEFCNVRCTSEKDFKSHLDGKRHRVGCLLHALSNNMRGKLVADKEEITVTSAFNKDKGVISFDVEHKQEMVVTVTLRNTSKKDNIRLCGYELLKPLRQFKLVYQQRAMVLTPGSSFDVQVKVKLHQFGHRTVPLAFLFIKESEPSERIHIVRFLQACCVNQVIKDLRPTAPYRKPTRVAVGNISKNIIDGYPLPESPVPKKLENEVKLEQYWVPEHVRKVVNSGLKDYNGLDDNAKQVRELLKLGSLHETNYNQMLQNLLWVEEIQMEVDIRQYDMEKVTMKIYKENKRLMVLEVPGLAEKRPSVLRGDGLYVTFVHDGKPEDLEYKGYVHEVREKELCLGFHEKLMKKHLPGTKFNVRFTFSRFPLRLSHRSVQFAEENSLYPLLFPTSLMSTALTVPLSTPLKFYDQLLEHNTHQVSAVKHILAGSSRPTPYIIFGPPGTGKTVTVVEAIKQVVKHIPSAHVLACAPSNAAVDLIAERLIKDGHVSKRDIYRMNALSRDHRTIPENLRSISNWNTQYSAFEYPSKETLTKFKIILCTIVTAGRLVSANFPAGHFTHIFLDESGHAIEPEAVIPIAGILECGLSKDGGQVVLAGDPKQLGPVLRSPIAITCGLGVSLLERLMNTASHKRGDNGYNQCFVAKLLHNYRSHPSILHLPNEMFYHNELVAKADKLAREVMCAWEELPQKGFPLVFHGVVGKDQREERSPSFFNPAEVATVVDYVEKLLTCRKIKVKKSDIGVVTPYTRQVQKIKKVFRQKNWGDINVGSTEEFQGQEKKILLISTVRSSPGFMDMDLKFNLGFVINPKRFNVSITRAKALLIVIGNPFYLSKDECWGKLLEYCVGNGAYKGVEFTEDDSSGQEWEETFNKFTQLGLRQAIDEDSVQAELVYDRQHIQETGWKSDL